MESVGISVVIPVYNCEAYVAKAIESILNQPYKMIQIILVNDGSKDGSPAICDQYAAKYDRVHVIHQENSGVAAARNAGLEYVLSHDDPVFRQGYIGFLDADDAWMKDFFDKETVELFYQGYHLVGFQTSKCNSKMTRYAPARTMNAGLHYGKASSVWVNSSQTFGSAFYALSVIEQHQIRFPNGLRANEDVIFSMQFKYLADKMYLVNRLLYLYRNNQTSVSHKKRNVIDKYTEMMDAYFASDAKMEQYQTEQRGHLQEGHAMVAVYMIEMHQEHYRSFGRQRELDDMLAKRPELLDLITGDFARNRPDSGLKWKAMKAHPVKFKLCCYAEGAMNSIMRRIYLLTYKSKWLTTVIDKKRYPVLIEGE